jgi:hypothetical protein
MNAYANLRDLERLSGITWHELVALESKLSELLWEARQACVRCRRRSDVDRVFAPLRDSLTELVGFGGKNRSHPVLGSAGAYQIAYWKLYGAVTGLLHGRAGVAPITAGNWDWQRSILPHKQQPAPKPCRRRFNRVTIGFWLGGLVLGTVGCIIGACIPYRHPVGVALSALWWGIYLGCFGASIGALSGLWTNSPPLSSSRPEDAGILSNVTMCSGAASRNTTAGD